MRRVSVRRGVAVLALLAVCLFPVAAFADETEIHVPIGAPAVSQQASAQGEISVPIGFWGAAFLVLLEASA